MVHEVAARRPRSATWPAYGAFIGALLYGAMKVDLARKGQAGIAGFPNRPGHQQDHGGQWGNVAVAAICAAVALATVQSWGRSIPRRILLTASWTICAGLGQGPRCWSCGSLAGSCGRGSRPGVGHPVGRDCPVLPAALA